MRLLPLLLLAACPKPTDPAAAVPSTGWDAIPRLPAPAAATYARSRETPSDPPLAKLVAGHPWDAALSGAAAGLALDLIHQKTPVVTRWRVREALWKAGYPYPATDARAWKALEDGGPPPELLTWLATVSADDDLGLVRARGDLEDLWVGLTARPRAVLGPIPRQVAQGGALALPAVPGATYTVADANGHVQTGSLAEGATIEAGSQGEWMVRIREDDALVAMFPVYVGVVPPATRLLEDAAPASTPNDALGRTEALLAGIRGVYGAPPLARDFMLDAGARSLLQGRGSSREGVVTSLGLEPSRTALWVCEGHTVEACLDGMIWEPENRLALLDDGSALGLAADVTGEGVRMVGIVAPTR